MRRAEREIKEMNKIIEVIDQCDTIRIGLSDENGPYIVPLSFGYTYCNDTLTFYFHSASEGRKIELLKSGAPIGFELDCNHRVTEASAACGYSMLFQSVIGTGTPHLIQEKEQKLDALKQLMAHYTQEQNLPFADKMLDIVTVYAITVDTISGKEHVR